MRDCIRLGFTFFVPLFWKLPDAFFPKLPTPNPTVTETPTPAAREGKSPLCSGFMPNLSWCHWVPRIDTQTGVLVRNVFGGLWEPAKGPFFKYVTGTRNYHEGPGNAAGSFPGMIACICSRQAMRFWP